MTSGRRATLYPVAAPRPRRKERMAKSILEAFKHQASKYGEDGCMETAAELGMSYNDLCLLQKHIDSNRPRHAPKHRLSVETRVKRILGIDPNEED